MRCSNNLKQIALALHNYHDDHGTFPPAYIADEQRRRLHSWRVLILPYLEEHALYDAYDFDEPWDGTSNRKLAGAMPDVYRCPGAEQGGGVTSYLAVVGEQTAWPGATGTGIDDVTDGCASTLLVVEHHRHDVLWLEPADPDLESFVGDVSAAGPELQGHQSETFFYLLSIGRNVAFADGSVRWLPLGLPREVWQELLVVDDGSAWSERDVIGSEGIAVRQLRPGNVALAVLFIALVLLPLPWVWIRR